MATFEHLYFGRNYLSAWILIFAIVLASCGRNRPSEIDARSSESERPITAQDDAISQPEADQNPLPATRLTDVNLLKAEHIAMSCDGSDGADFACAVENGLQILTVDLPPSEFARWRLTWDQQVYARLSGTETLHLMLQSAGTLLPNLYLIDASERRIPTKIFIDRTKTGAQEIFLPLAEIKDEAGDGMDFESVSGLELVFEWADMQGELTLEIVRFTSAWWKTAHLTEKILEAAALLSVPEGFVVEPIAAELPAMTQIQFIDNSVAGDQREGGYVLVSQQNGRIWRLADENQDGYYERRQLVTAGFAEVVGLLYDPLDQSIWLGGRGQLYNVSDTNADGVADEIELRIDGLPWGRHQNNGLAWNPDPDPFSGEAGNSWIYFGLGSTGDLEVGGELNATVLRFPRDGQGAEALEVVSRGNRNAYALAWGQVADDGRWQLFASENGPDFNDAPDEVNHIRWQHHYGFPERFGSDFEGGEFALQNLPYSGSLYDVTPHASASGLAFVAHPQWPEAYRTLYVSLFGQVFSEEVVGHTVERISLIPIERPSGPTFRGEPSTFVSGLDRPLPLTTDPEGNLVVGDYASGVIYRVRIDSSQ